jgi:zinc transport system substrate-binding protein
MIDESETWAPWPRLRGHAGMLGNMPTASVGMAPVASLLLLLTMVFFAAPSVADEPMVVFVSVPPQASLVKAIGGPHVTTEFLVLPGQDPHTFEPMPKQMIALGRARLFFTVGMPFENVLLERVRADYRRLAVVDATRGIKKRMVGPHDGHFDRGDEATHAAEAVGPDPHVWLSPAAIKTMAANMAESLGQVDPVHADEYRENLKTLLKEVDAQDKKIRALLTPFRGQSVYVYHPALGYFCDAFGLKQKAVETGGKSPTPRQLLALIKQAKADGVKVIFVQRGFDQRAAQTVAESIGGEVVPIDPLAENVLNNLEEMARAIAKAMGGER